MQGAKVCGLTAALDKLVNIYLEALTAWPLHEMCNAKPRPGKRALEAGQCGLSLAGPTPPALSVLLFVKRNGGVCSADSGAMSHINRGRGQCS